MSKASDANMGDKTQNIDGSISPFPNTEWVVHEVIMIHAADHVM